MRTPKRSPEGIAEEAAFSAVKEFAGVVNIFDQGFKEVLAKFSATYKAGMTPEQALEAFKAAK